MAVVQSHILSKVIIPDVDLAEVDINGSSLLSSIIEEVIVHDQGLTGVLQVDCSTSLAFELVEVIVNDVHLITPIAMDTATDR